MEKRYLLSVILQIGASIYKERDWLNLPLVDRATSVSSIRNTNAAFDLGWSSCPFLATNQLYKAVRAPPTCKLPVGEGANRIRGGAVSGFNPSNGNLAGNSAICVASCSVYSIIAWKVPYLKSGYRPCSRCNFSINAIQESPDFFFRSRRNVPKVLGSTGTCENNRLEVGTKAYIDKV